MNELSPEQYLAIKKFADGLKECYRKFIANHPKEPMVETMLDYAIEIIDLHLQLADLEVEAYLNAMAKAAGEK